VLQARRRELLPRARIRRPGADRPSGRGGAEPARPLGTVVTDTILACGNWILWENHSVSGGNEAYEINRWRPGLAQPQRIYTSPAGAALTPLTCQNDMVYVETAYLSSSPTYTETISAAV
jgi:hypothetical protein